MPQADENRPESILDDAVHRFMAAELKGEALNLTEFLKDYPGLEEQLRQRVQDCQQISSLLDSLRQIGEGEFHDSHAEDLVGQRIGVFEVTGVLGHGGMGVVYRANDTRLDRIVALKTMPPRLLGDPVAQLRFRHEAKMLAALNHPHIGGIYDILEQEGGSCYLVLEHIPGQTLAERVAEGPLPLSEALGITEQIAQALAAAHDKGIMHRDLKPSNVKLGPNGEVKVLDFGIGKVLQSHKQNAPTTGAQQGQLIGTPAYMSPEQARGELTDERTDIWSLGCVMYEMLTGKLAFPGKTTSETLASILEGKPDWAALPDATPDTVVVLLRRCLEKDPRARPQHAGEIAAHAHETLTSLTAPESAIIPSRPTRREASRKTPLRKLGLVAVIAAIVFSGLAYRRSLVERAQTSNVVPSLPQMMLAQNDEAYDYYLRGYEYSSRGHQHRDDLETAIGRYEKAVRLDESFALAWARLSWAYAALYWHHSWNKEHRASAEAAARKALELDSDLPEAHYALGCCYYWGHYDYERALAEFEIARASQPDNSQIIAMIGYVQRQQGDFEQALGNLKAAYELDPRSHVFATEIALTLLSMRQYAEAEDFCDRAIELAPDQPKAYEWKACIHLRWHGDTGTARDILEQALDRIKLKDNTGSIAYWLVTIDVYEGAYQAALDQMASQSNGVENMNPFDVVRYAQICGYMGDVEMANEWFAVARVQLQARLEEQPEHAASWHSVLGIACAGLGLTEEALREGRQGVALLPMATERRRGAYRLEDLARINVMLGRHDEAIEQIERLLGFHGRLSIPLLKLDPAWDPLREHPRFQRLMQAGE